MISHNLPKGNRIDAAFRIRRVVYIVLIERKTSHDPFVVATYRRNEDSWAHGRYFQERSDAVKHYMDKIEMFKDVHPMSE